MFISERQITSTNKFLVALDYNKIFSDDDSWFSGHGKAYESLGIDASAGCVVIVRPDQYVAAVTTLDDYASIGKYFGKFMLEA